MGVVWLDGYDFSDGVIEVDMLGRSQPVQGSFLGVAFRVVDAKTHDVVYFRPFNFRAVSRKPSRRFPRSVIWNMKLYLFLLFLGCIGRLLSQAPNKGTLLEDLTWVEAERVLKEDTIVVIPLGAQSKEHGPHLRLKNDFVQAEYLKKRVLSKADVVVAPTINYSYYPAFLEYPGSISLEVDTARNMIIEVCLTLSHYGPKRFYVINEGISTVAALQPAAELLAAHGILLRFTDLETIIAPVEKALRQEEGGTHADEIETSQVLYIAPDLVNMKKAVKDYHPSPGGLTRNSKGPGAYSASGIYGDATLATREKGEKLIEALVAGILSEIEALRHSTLPHRSLDALDLNRYTGKYVSGSAQIAISQMNGQLWVERDGQSKVLLAPISESRFTTHRMPVTFLFDEKSRASFLVFVRDGKETLAKRATE
jgi:creatinine amidohydrolase